MTDVRGWLSGPVPVRVVVLCWAIFALVWVLAALKVKRTVERSSGWWWRVAIIAVALAFMSRSQAGAHWWSGSARLWPSSTTTGVVGDVVAVIGLAITLWARVTLGGNWSAVVSIKEGHELIERGPYRFVRHPIYTGILVMLLGTAIVDGHAVWIVALVAAFIGLSIKARSEERLLSKHFPEAYPSYRRRVKAIIPFVV